MLEIIFNLLFVLLSVTFFIKHKNQLFRLNLSFPFSVGSLTVSDVVVTKNDFTWLSMGVKFCHLFCQCFYWRIKPTIVDSSIVVVGSRGVCCLCCGESVCLLA